MTEDRFASKAHDWHMNPQIIAMFWAFVKQYHAQIPLNADMDLLDVGGGTGLIAIELASSVRTVTIADSSHAMVEVARARIEAEHIQNVTVLEGDALDTPDGSSRYDRIYAHMSMHHMQNTEGVLARFYALLRPGGILVIADLVTEDGSMHGAEGVPHNGFDVPTLSEQLGQAGFVSVSERPLPPLERGTDPVRSYERFFLIGHKQG